MNTKLSLLTAALCCTAAFVGLVSFQAMADDDERGERGERRMVSAPNPVFEAECTACHIAYPAGLLPAASWKQMMGNLENHFGSDASLDAESNTAVLNYLLENAASDRYFDAANPPERITDTRWFKRKHDEVSNATWKKIKSPADCSACHRGADKGDFDEDNVRMPR